MYIAEPDPSVNKNGSVHERVGIDTGVRSCESNRPPVEAQPGERACAANHPGGVLIGSEGIQSRAPTLFRPSAIPVSGRSARWPE